MFFFSETTVNHTHALVLTAWALPFLIPILIISHRFSLTYSSQRFRKVVYLVVTILGSVILTRALVDF